MRDRLELRALDPVARCLIRRLTVPRIYFEAPWPAMPGDRVDVLFTQQQREGPVAMISLSDVEVLPARPGRHWH